MKSLKCFAAAGIAVLFAAGSAQAAIVNPSFETPGLAGWSTVGMAVAADGTIGVSPTDGTFQALLIAGAGSVSPAVIESAVGLFPGDLASLNSLFGLAAPFEGSAIYQTFTAAAGDSVTVDLDFLTNELLGGIDVAYALLTDSGGFFAGFASFGMSGGAPVPSGFTAHSGYSTNGSVTLAAGTYTLSFIALDGVDDAADAGMLIDNIVYTPAAPPPPPAVPEPGSMALALVGLAGLGLRRLRQRRQPIAS